MLLKEVSEGTGKIVCVCGGGVGGMVDDMRKVDWKSGAYLSSRLAYFAANPQYLGVFPISTTCGHALLGMVALSLNWKLTCQG